MIGLRPGWNSCRPSSGGLPQTFLGTANTLHALSASAASHGGFVRDTSATYEGVLWLGLGRLSDAREAFARVGHVGQRRWNLVRMADLLDDRQQMIELLSSHGWAYNPVPFARAGLLRRAHEIMQQPKSSGLGTPHHAVARGEEALAARRFDKAIEELQRGFDLLRARPTNDFYTTAMSLARAWHEVGDTSQELLVLEDAFRTRPPYGFPGLGIAWWIKTQVHLISAYGEASRFEDAEALEDQVRKLLSQADADHPILKRLATRRKEALRSKFPSAR